MKYYSPSFLFIFILGFGAYAEEKSIQPYIDEVKKEFKEKETETPSENKIDPYIQSIKSKFKKEEKSNSVEPYIDSLKAENPEKFQKEVPKPYTEEKKAQLGPAQEGGAIEAVKEGRSELHARMKGEIHHAFGLKFAPAFNPDISSTSQQIAYSSVYGNSLPGFSVFYEYQPFHSEWFGNIGILGSVGAAFSSGFGQFQFPVQNVATGTTFPSNSQTKFQFTSLPVSLGADYRFNLFRVLRPYVLIAPTAIGYMETRNDGVPNKHGIGRSLLMAGGVNFPLNWISSKASWDLYEQYGVQRYYLSVEFSRMQDLGGDVLFDYYGINVGLTFEY